VRESGAARRDRLVHVVVAMAQASRRTGRPRLGERIRVLRDHAFAAWSAPVVEWIADCANRGAVGPLELALIEHPSGLAEAVDQLGRLRDAIVRACTDGSTDLDDLRAMHRGIDRLIGLVVNSEHARVLREAREAVRVREDVLAVVSHDLRNPLGAIDLSAAMLLQRVECDARSQKQLETIRRSAQRMEHMINDLLDMASIQAGHLALERKPEDARALLDDVLDIHTPLATERGIAIERSCDLTGILLDCDRDRVAQVFGNLTGNALKFCRRGDKITIDAAVDGKFVRFSFRDSGPGIAAQDLPHLFEPYYSARRHAKQGTGLGLFICKGIVDAHGGTIRADNAPGAGAQFTLTLPMAG
jgi:signal transduction histidine kinase